jgi:hypothetical protein
VDLVVEPGTFEQQDAENVMGRSLREPILRMDLPFRDFHQRRVTVAAQWATSPAPACSGKPCCTRISAIRVTWSAHQADAGEAAHQGVGVPRDMRSNVGKAP